jgi:hypothetical protein
MWVLRNIGLPSRYFPTSYTGQRLACVTISKKPAANSRSEWNYFARGKRLLIYIGGTGLKNPIAV